MAAYFIVDVDVTDAEAYTEYTRGVPDTLDRYGGRFLVRGGATEVIEGEWQPRRLVVLEFASVEQARAWYASPEYQAILPIRWRNSTANMILAEGV